MRTYYSFTIFAEPACELNTNQKNDLQTQSAFCQVCLLVSGQSTFFWYFQQIMQSISAEKRPKNVQNPSVCKRFMISGSVSESWVFQSNGRPELVPAVLDKVALAATVECLQISFLGLGSAKMIYKQFLRFYKQLLEFYKQFLEFYKQFLEFYKQFLEFCHSQRIETRKKPVAERATTPFSAIRNLKVRKTCHRESSGGHGPTRYQIPKSQVAKTKFSISGAASNLQHLTARIG